MAIILSADVVLFECGTCGDAILVPKEPPYRDADMHDPAVSEWFKRHREGCPSRLQAIPKTLPPDTGAAVAE